MGCVENSAMSYMISPEAIGLQARRLRITCEVKGERLRE